jgi:hypothetical protein
VSIIWLSHDIATLYLTISGNCRITPNGIQVAVNLITVLPIKLNIVAFATQRQDIS